MRSRPAPEPTRALLAAAALLPLGVLAALHARPAGLHSFVALPWWVLALFLAVTEAGPVRVRYSGWGATAVSFTGVPVAVALFLAAPAQLLAGRLTAVAAVAALTHARDLRALVARVGAAAAGTGATLAVFAGVVALTPLRAGSGAALISGPNGAHAVGIASALAAVLAAMPAGAAIETLAGLAVDRADPERRRSVPPGPLLALSAALAMGCGVAALAAVLASADGRAALTLGVTGSAALLVHQVFASLADRQASLERLYALSDALAAAPGYAEVVGLVLTGSIELLHAERAEVRLSGVDGGRTLHWWLDAGGQVQGPIEASGQLEPAGPARAGGLGVVTPGWLAVPVRAAGGGQLMVRGGPGEGRRFRPGDARLLETVANHASVALRNGQLIDRLHFEARHDELTGLPNRLAFRELLEVAAQRAAAGEAACAVMLIDFDGFKAINDTLGHQAGDDLLRVLAARLAATAAERATVARLGGDEFAVLTTTDCTEQAAGQLARTLLTVFDEPVAVAGTRLRVGGSLGIALGPAHGRTGSDLLRNSDIAMYAAKGGAGGMRLFSADLVEVTAQTLTLASDLRDALTRDEVDVAVQPIVDLGTGRLHSVEVLARWHHPELGELAPEAFFAAAERSGQVTALSARILDRALSLCRGWQDSGRQVRVAVNLAARWLADPALPEQVAQALHRHGVSPDMLCLEITERSVIADPHRIGVTLRRLRDLGVHLSVDDFGTGYSSLTYLSRLPVDQLKIDKEFVQRMRANDRDLAIVRSIVDLGRHLGLEVVAEGVTDPAARRELARIGCALAQGFLFARPLDPGDLPGYLDAAALPAPRRRRERRVSVRPPVDAV